MYKPTVARDQARKSALRHMLKTFFSGSPEQAMAALLDLSGPRMSREELDRLAGLVEKAKKEGR